VRAVSDGDDRLRVVQVNATLGWGDRLYVDVYAVTRHKALDDLDAVLRKAVAAAFEKNPDRITIRWRIRA
jgi:hypothetical protein